MGTLHNRFLNNVVWEAKPANDLHLSEVHIYRIPVNSNLRHYSAFLAMLTADEKAIAQRFLREVDRNKFIVRRAAQRVILGRYLTKAPQDLTFAPGDNKKPFLLGDDTLQYNISHSADRALLAVARIPIGVDIEHTDREFRFAEILPGYFSADEIAFIGVDGDAAGRFYTLWTRKEAFLKATAQGLDEHLALMPGLDGIHQLSKHLWGFNKHWALNNFSVDNDYLGAIAVDESINDIRFFDFDYLRSL
jgi:4'-phosphopantetheinyl transferase